MGMERDIESVLTVGAGSRFFSGVFTCFLLHWLMVWG